MNTFLNAQLVPVVVPVPDDAVSYTWRLVDQGESEISPMTTSAPVPGDPEITLQIVAELNTLPDGQLRMLRSVEVYFFNGTNTSKVTVEYLVEADQTLVVNVNTFQTYGESLLGSYDLFGLTGWGMASKQERMNALVAARRNIAELRFRYVFDSYQNIVEPTVGVSDLTLISQANWDALPADFKAALKRAQILEADYLLTGGESELDAKRRSGIISETIGESSMFMRSSKPLERSVCKRAMKELSKYVLNRVRITRS